MTAPRTRVSTTRWRLAKLVKVARISGHRAEIISTLSRKLVPGFGRGIDVATGRPMVQFAEAYLDAPILAAPLRQYRQARLYPRVPRQPSA